MSDYSNNEQMLDMYLFETCQNIEQLEDCILNAEKTKEYSQDSINEIFRIMHTIKGSSAMMLFNGIAALSHSMEDLFYFIREQKPQLINTAALTDLLLEGIDYIKVELENIKEHCYEENACPDLINKIRIFLADLKGLSKSNILYEPEVNQEKIQYYIVPDESLKKTTKYCYKVIIFFEDGCEMENIRAYTIIHNLKQDTAEMKYIPGDILENEGSIQVIREKGFQICFKSNKSYNETENFFNQTIFLKSINLMNIGEEEYLQFTDSSYNDIVNYEIKMPELKKADEKSRKEKESITSFATQSIISVNVTKLDKLMDLIGEMVISEALVTQNPDLEGLELDNFQKAARQHHKIISEVQDMVMAIRMVPLAATFHKMHRLVRDMNKNLNKETELVLIGEETEVDKNIIEHISDPLMHLIRNSLDHGIENSEEREALGKDKIGKIIIEAKNSGSDVLICIKDDGKGLSKDKILAKAREHGLINKSESEMTEREIFNLILLPGFSTKDDVSEYSGRGVGMDVVAKNLETIGGSVIIESTEGIGTSIILKIPLTLAIIDGMNIKVGDSRYTIPTAVIMESFRPESTDIIIDPDENEMIMVRGKCYNIKRLHQLFEVNTDITNFKDGVFIMVEQDKKSCCLFADELLGQQQVVVKTLPDYITKIKNINGISGCTLLGDGNISLILDIAGII